MSAVRDDPAADPWAIVADLRRERDEALAREAAMAEVMQVISASPGDLGPVFEAILHKAHSLCGAELGSLFTYDGELFWPVAAARPPAPFNELMREGFRPGPGNPFARVLEGEPLVHIADIAPLAARHPDDAGLRVAVEVGLRTFMVVPLHKDNVLLGVITATRREVRPFSDKQIALLQNFAAQAVIAMENARLLTETREALEQQTATAEVRGVINSSPGDLAPVFDAMLEKATTLCEAAFGTMLTYDGERFQAAAFKRAPERYAEFMKQGPFVFAPETGPGRLLAGEPFVRIDDATSEKAYTSGDAVQRALVDLAGARSLATVPLRKDDALLGSITVYRQEVRPFSDTQVSLLQNFAAQAVIAMENARLITETREALDQQTATAEVLGVINSSPGDPAPVFAAMLEKAMTLCGAAFGTLQTYNGQSWQSAATQGVPEAFAEYRRRNPPPYGPGTISDRILSGEPLVHSVDLMSEELYQTGDPNRRAMVDLGGARTSLVVPLRKDSVVLGVLQIYRQHVEPFSDRQIALFQNFAAQAVIAMENARLLTETREALEQQTATAEVLQVINSSPGDLTPVGRDPRQGQ